MCCKLNGSQLKLFGLSVHCRFINCNEENWKLFTKRFGKKLSFVKKISRDFLRSVEHCKSCDIVC